MPENNDSARLAVIESTVLDIKTRLFGRDGDRGQIGNLDHRITKLENWRWWVVGIGVGLGIAVGLGARSIVETLLKT